MDRSAEMQVYYSHTDAMVAGIICRLCANISSKVVGIYSIEGRLKDLAQKIMKYLPIIVTEQDSLPLQCCLNCTTTLLAWHELYSQCKCADQKLSSCAKYASLGQGAAIVKDEESVRFNDPLSLEKPRRIPELGQHLEFEQKLEVEEPDEDVEPEEEAEGEDENGLEQQNFRDYKHNSLAEDDDDSREQGDDLGQEQVLIENESALNKSDCFGEGVELELELEDEDQDQEEEDQEDEEEEGEFVESELLGEGEFLEESELLAANELLVDGELLKSELRRERVAKEEHQVDVEEMEFEDEPKEALRIKREGGEAVRGRGLRPKPQKLDQEAVNAAKVVVDGRVYYNCKVCGKSLYSPYTYMWHMRIHTGERPYVCDLCGKQFRVSQGLVRHLKETHQGIKRFACDLCERKFATKRNVEEHRRIHTNERPYVCDLCGKAFKQKASLFVHNRSHTDFFPYQCSYCNQGFRTRPTLLLHVTRHTGEKPYPCEVCGRCFRIKYELKRHQLIHSDVKPFACAECGLRFRQKRYLRNHNKSNHNRSTV